MSKDNDTLPRQQKEEQDWLWLASRLAPLLSLALKILELALKYFKRI